MESNQVRLTIPVGVSPVSIIGVNDDYLHLIESRFGSRITVRGDQILIAGDKTEGEMLTSLFTELVKRAQAGEPMSRRDLIHAIELLRNGEYAPKDLREDVLLTFRGKAIRPKTAGQKRYVDAIRTNTITFGIGPAGTGKTYLAMALALSALQHREYKRIILTRPVVEAGESLGFLPGTLTEKVDPYIRPLYDAIYDLVDNDRGDRLIESGMVEVAPLAYMRGRTLNDSFIILDEAQNTTPDQMKMFLTRLGFGSKMVVTGDITQVDLTRGLSGLRTVEGVLAGIDDIAFVTLSAHDVVRHSLVAAIVDAYDRADRRRLEAEKRGGATAASKKTEGGRSE